MNQALDKIEELTNSNQIRRFTGNDYLQDIQNGNFAACIAWSGDIAQTANPDVHFVFPEEGAMAWFDTMVIPIEAANGVAAAAVDELRVRPGQRGPDHRTTCSSSARSPACARSCRSWAATPPPSPTTRCCSPTTPRGRTPTCSPTCRRSSTSRSPTASSPSPEADVAAAVADNRAQKPARCAPYLMSLPGLLCLYLFFIVPLVTLLKIALSVRVPGGGTSVDFSWEWAQLLARRSRTSASQLWRAFAYAGVATVLCVLIAYPIAYFIAFKAGKWANLMLGLVMVPFFTSFLLRTIAWQSLFADQGPVLGIADRLHLIGRARRPAHHHRRQDHEHRAGGDRRADLQLHAVRPAPDLRQPGEGRAQPHRRRLRPVLELRRARSAR